MEPAAARFGKDLPGPNIPLQGAARRANPPVGNGGSCGCGSRPLWRGEFWLRRWR